MFKAHWRRTHTHTHTGKDCNLRFFSSGLPVGLYVRRAALTCLSISHHWPTLGALRSQRLIQAAFSKNDLLKNLDEAETRGVIACMYPTAIHQGCSVIQEGASGAQAYVVEGNSSSLHSLSNIQTPLRILINAKSEMTGDQGVSCVFIVPLLTV